MPSQLVLHIPAQSHRKAASNVGVTINLDSLEMAQTKAVMSPYTCLALVAARPLWLAGIIHVSLAAIASGVGDRTPRDNLAMVPP